MRTPCWSNYRYKWANKLPRENDWQKQKVFADIPLANRVVLLDWFDQLAGRRRITGLERLRKENALLEWIRCAIV